MVGVDSEKSKCESRASYPLTSDGGEDVEAFMLVAHMGGDARRYQREKKQGIRRLVSEIYSPPRVAKMLAKMPSDEILPGVAFDIATYDGEGQPWAFSQARMSKRTVNRTIM